MIHGRVNEIVAVTKCHSDEYCRAILVSLYQTYDIITFKFDAQVHRT